MRRSHHPADGENACPNPTARRYPSLAAARSRIRWRSSALGGGFTTSEARARLLRFRTGTSADLSDVCVGSFCCMVIPGYVIQKEALRWN
jgi:hypothetical protein